jgi:CDP-glucose 4,6-dehydratase
MTSDKLLPFESALRGKKVLVTGHTGFTGGWVCAWLRLIGAEVSGFSLRPVTKPSLYDALGADSAIDSVIGDVRDLALLEREMARIQPEAVLHLAAQPLVRQSYSDPVGTFDTNIMGTVNVLEASRRCGKVGAIVCVTTDKVYRNNEWVWPYRENDPLGGKDPYSASKSAAEMVIDSYRYSFTGTGSSMAIATARGGNIVGGGDWSDDRLVPDFVRAITSGTPITLRYPNATRPWQHVLALAQGYLMLLAELFDNPLRAARAWNLGPHESKHWSVREVLDVLAEEWRAPEVHFMDSPLSEARALALDSTQAANNLGWIPPWDTRRVITETARWYQQYYESPAAARRVTEDQLGDWRNDLHLAAAK